MEVIAKLKQRYHLLDHPVNRPTTFCNKHRQNLASTKLTQSTLV